MALIARSDFDGYYRIAFDNANGEIIDDLIVKLSEKYLNELMGYELYQLFKTDLGNNATPTEQRFVDIFTDLCYSNGEPCLCADGGVIKSKGIKQMLLGFLYFHFLNDYQDVMSLTGPVRNLNENSQQTPQASFRARLEERYNLSVQYYETIRQYMDDNEDTYPEFDGICKEPVYWGGI